MRYENTVQTTTFSRVRVIDFAKAAEKLPAEDDEEDEDDDDDFEDPDKMDDKMDED